MSADFSERNGHISFDGFTSGLTEWCRLSEEFPGFEWQLRKASKGYNQCYAVHRTSVKLPLCEEWCMEYHILYSQTFSVPVLYLNGWRSNGSLLTMDEIRRLCKGHHQESVLTDVWKVLTPAEHPVLGKPWFMLNPCNHAKMISKIEVEFALNHASYILTWLSSLAPLVGLCIPLEISLKFNTLIS